MKGRCNMPMSESLTSAIKAWIKEHETGNTVPETEVAGAYGLFLRVLAAHEVEVPLGEIRHP